MIYTPINFSVTFCNDAATAAPIAAAAAAAIIISETFLQIGTQ